MRGLAVLLVALPALAQTPLQPDVLHAWTFADDAGGWIAAHSTAVAHANGALQIRVTGADPYVHASAGHVLDIEGKPTQFIRIRLRSSHEGNAQFFWAASTEGRDAGFVAGQEVSFPVAASHAWQTLDVYPGWEGRVTRLRFDASSDEVGAVVVIDDIAVMEWPLTLSDGPVWDFAAGQAGWLPRGAASLAFGTDGLRLEGDAVEIAAGRSLEPPLTGWLTLDADVPADGTLTATWRDPSGALRLLQEPLRAGAGPWALRFADALGGGAPGAVPARIDDLRLRFDGVSGPRPVVLRRLALGPTPHGPARLQVRSAELSAATATVREPVTLRVEVQNAGGEPLSAGTLRPGLDRPALAPGERATLETELVPREPGVTITRVGDDGPTVALAVSQPPGEPTGTGPSVTADTAALTGERVRLRAGAAGEGRHGPLWLEVRDGDGWRRVATLPAIGNLAVDGNWRTAETVPARVEGDALVFATEFATATDPNGWRAEAWYRLAGPDRIAVEHRLIARPPLPRGTALPPERAPAQVSHFSGPWLRVGDGTTGAALGEAVFPGLEYLGTDLGSADVSSNPRDATPPHNLHYVPHRHNITIPMMAVTTPQRDLVALLWSHDGQGEGPAAVFASPNTLETPRSPVGAIGVGRSGQNHLLGLFLPSVPEQVDENRLRAREPLVLAPGESLTLESQILARPNAEVIDAVKAWVDIYKPASPGEVEWLLPQTLKWSRDGLEETLWTDGRGWMAHPARQDYSLNPGIAARYHWLAWLLDEPALAKLARERVPQTNHLPLALHQGGVASALRALAEGGRGALAGQDPGGGWSFQPDEKRAVLGAAGDTNVGIMAPQVVRALEGVRATGDEAMLAEALEALAQLDRFRIPRGAQVWEVPLHGPDILAAAHAVDAYRLAWELTGERRYLEKAQYWAGTALPFIYHWQHPRADLAPMRGGSIPVFAATFYTNAWWGRLVQWNGLAVAGALQRLADAGGGDEWARVAEDLAVSAQRQQVSDPNHEAYGTYPDYWNMRTGNYGYWINPDRLLTNVLLTAGHTPEGAWQTLRSGGELISVVSPTPLVTPTADGTALPRVGAELPATFNLAFGIDYPLGETAFVGLAGAGQPARITVDGAPLPGPVPDLDAVDEGWTHDPGVPALVLKLRFAGGPRTAGAPRTADAPRTVAIEGLAAADAETVSAHPAWSFERGNAGWGEHPHNVSVAVRDGRLVAEADGDDPYFGGPALALAGDAIGRIRLRARTTAAGPVVVYWANDDGYGPERQASTAPIPADGAFHEVEATLAGRPGWGGTLRRLRLDPPGEAGAVLELEWIRLEP